MKPRAAPHRPHDGVQLYLTRLRAEAPEYNPGNLRYALEYLFEGVPLADRRVLDVGAGDGVYTFYAAAAGAKRVVALEPEAAGSTAGVAQRFERLADRLGIGSVELVPQTFQTFSPHERFDVALFHSSVNHLDEAASSVLHRDRRARETYRGLFAKLADMSADGARVIVADASRTNLFARLPVKNPIQPDIEWQKHQRPRVWAELLEEAGFVEPRIRWTSLSSLRKPGRLLLGNPVGAWLTLGAFCLTMTRARRG
jgi:SAM-dependent methyltransferase